MSDCIVRISNDGHFRDSEWNITVNLKELADIAGKRNRDLYDGTYFVDYPITRAKKLLKVIREYGTEDDFQKCDEHLVNNKKLAAFWKTIR